MALKPHPKDPNREKELKRMKDRPGDFNNLPLPKKPEQKK